MPNKNDILEQIIDNLFKLSDKSKEEYNSLLKKFNLDDIRDMENLSLDKLESLLNLSKLSIKSSSKKSNLYTEKDFEQTLKNILTKQALKLK
jgi:hypothetical protein